MNTRLRATTNGTSPTAGTGIEIFDNSTSGVILSYNRGGSAYYPLSIQALDLTVQTNGSDALTIDSSQRLITGGSTSVATHANNHAALQIQGTDIAKAKANIQLYRNDASGPLFEFVKSRGATAGAVGTAVQSGDSLGTIHWFGDDGIDVQTVGSKIDVVVNGNVGTSVIPTDMIFYTSDTQSRERMRIDTLGNIGIGTTSPYAKLSVVGEVVAEYFTATSTTATSTFVGATQIGLVTIPYGKLLVTEGAGTLPTETITGATTAIFQNNNNTSQSSVVSIIGGTAANSGLYFGDSSDENSGYILYAHGTDSLSFRAGGAGTALTIDSSNNATFTGSVTAGAASFSGDATFGGAITSGSIDKIVASSANIVDVFLYDTTKDSDGGAWRDATQGTSWYNETLNDAEKTFDIDISKLNKTSDVWYDDAEYKDLTGIASLTLEEDEHLRQEIIAAKARLSELGKAELEKIVNNSEFKKTIQIFINANVRAGEHIKDSAEFTKEFLQFHKERTLQDVESLKSELAKQKRHQKVEAKKSFIEQNQNSVYKLIDLYNHLNEIKLILINKLNTIDGMKTFIRSGNGFEVTNPEGFVALGHSGDATKLVNRMEFSQQNFNK